MTFLFQYNHPVNSHQNDRQEEIGTMKKTLIKVAEAVVPELVRHSSIHISLAGWPAAVAVIAVGAAVVASVMILAQGQASDQAG